MKSGMNPSEFKFCEEAIDDGYEVLRSGWPDFLLLKDGKAIFVEVKRGSDRLTTGQLRMMRALKLLGHEAHVLHDGELVDPEECVRKTKNRLTADRYFKQLRKERNY